MPPSLALQVSIIQAAEFTKFTNRCSVTPTSTFACTQSHRHG